MLRVQRYDLEVMYTRGKLPIAADTLSRATDRSKSEKDLVIEKEVSLYVDMVIQCLPISEPRLAEIKSKTSQDETCKMLQKVILEGWPARKSDCDPCLMEYWNVRNELSVQDGIIFKGLNVVIPTKMRKSVLTKIHEGHLGIEKCRRRARSLLYWPGLNSSITEMINKCSTCLMFSANQPAEDLQPHDLPVHPWQKVGADIFTHSGKDYLVACDYFLNYIEVTQLSRSTSLAVVSAMKSIFARHGTVDVLITDNGHNLPVLSSKSLLKTGKLCIRHQARTTQNLTDWLKVL